MASAKWAVLPFSWGRVLLGTEDEGILAFGAVDAVCDFVETAQPLHRSKGLTGFYQNQTLNSTTQVDIFWQKHVHENFHSREKKKRENRGLVVISVLCTYQKGEMRRSERRFDQVRKPFWHYQKGVLTTRKWHFMRKNDGFWGLKQAKKKTKGWWQAQIIS